MDHATAYYKQLGWTVQDVGATQPFDLLLHRQPDEICHVEVKGSSGSASHVELTSGEVGHSRGEVACELFVCDQIQYVKDDLGGYSLHGGRDRVWKNWKADQDDLQPKRYQYALSANYIEPEVD